MKLPANKTDRQRTAITRNAVHRKKLIVAIVLFSIMAVLWVRVFVGKSKPAAVSAAPAIDKNKVLAVQNEGVEYIQLPHIPERHDVIANDVFSAKNFSQFKKQDQYVTSTKQLDTRDATGESPAVSAAEALRLVAIVNDKTPQAFIENRLFEKGDSFRFMFNGQIYQFKILNILEDKVVLDCNGIIITKKIPQPF
jgi:hypothetical protein